ncbi:MAG: 5-oxoprolinase subunit PxpB [Anaerolineaceae bacterium]|nr:5-oxoprolinase subunit PxpB [Anaerolineaceae bacterium]
MLPDPPLIQVCGDSAYQITFSENIDPSSNLKVYQLDRWLNLNQLEGFVEAIPSYSSLLVLYEPAAVSPAKMVAWINERINTCSWDQELSTRLIEVPVVYGGIHGVDLEAVAKTHSLTSEDVIQRHSQVEYTVAMMGFSPGFVYLSGMDESLATPRLASPRMNVPPGSIGIAGNQTGIYSIQSPGGWQLIGQTPISLFDPQSANPFYFSPGDRIRFKPISLAESGFNA